MDTFLNIELISLRSILLFLVPLMVILLLERGFKNSNTIVKQIIQDLCFILAIIFFVYVIAYSITRVKGYDSADIALLNTSSSIALTILTVGYVLLTYSMLNESKNAVKQSRDAIEQSKIEQQIRDIENRLEKFYIPAEVIINKAIQSKSRDDTIHGYQGGLKDADYVIGLKHLRKYSYLTTKTTYEAFQKYLTTNCYSRKPITCKDNYRDFNDYNCIEKNGNCMPQWGNCPKNY